MQLHVVLALVTYALLPLVAGWHFLRLWRRTGQAVTRFHYLGALLFGGVLSFPVTMVVWILGCLAVGGIWGLASGDLNAGLQTALGFAVPLTRDKDVVPYGLWFPLLAWLLVMGLATWLFQRQLAKRSTRPAS